MKARFGLLGRTRKVKAVQVFHNGTRYTFAENGDGVLISKYQEQGISDGIEIQPVVSNVIKIK